MPPLKRPWTVNSHALRPFFELGTLFANTRLMNYKSAHMTMMFRSALIAIAFTLSACSQVGDGLRFAVNNVNDLRYDAAIAWDDLKNYKAPNTIAPQPQLRYCYKMQSDIVCYDAPQPNSTAPLVGVQEGVPGRLIAGAPVIDANYAFAEPAPQHDVMSNDLDAPEDVGLLPDNSLPPSAEQTATFANHSIVK